MIFLIAGGSTWCVFSSFAQASFWVKLTWKNIPSLNRILKRQMHNFSAAKLSSPTFKSKIVIMKHIQKLGIVLFIISATTVTMHAQETAFGVKLGVNLSSMNLDDPEASYDSRTGYHLGIFLRGKFNKVAVQPEVLLFTQKGEVNRATLGNYENSFTYLSIPFMVKFYPVAGLNLQVGPQFGFLVDGEQTRTIGGFTTKHDITESYKSSDVSVSVGAGYDFGFGLGLDVRYNIGVKDINNEVDGDPAKSRVFMISLGWNFLK
jgi:hypothetical protein